MIVPWYLQSSPAFQLGNMMIKPQPAKVGSAHHRTRRHSKKYGDSALRDQDRAWLSESANLVTHDHPISFPYLPVMTNTLRTWSHGPVESSWVFSVENGGSQTTANCWFYPVRSFHRRQTGDLHWDPPGFRRTTPPVVPVTFLEGNQKKTSPSSQVVAVQDIQDIPGLK